MPMSPPVAIAQDTERNRFIDGRTVQAARTPLPDPLADMRLRMQDTQQWHGQQMAGRRWPIACLSLEITQRCNLDCTLCGHF